MREQVKPLTAAEAEKVNQFLAAARALPSNMTVECSDGVLVVMKRKKTDYGAVSVEAGKLKRKSLDSWA